MPRSRYHLLSILCAWHILIFTIPLQRRNCGSDKFRRLSKFPELVIGRAENSDSGDGTAAPGYFPCRIYTLLNRAKL